MGSSPYGPDKPTPYRQALFSHNLILVQKSPVPLLKFQMAIDGDNKTDIKAKRCENVEFL
jgi:hypothetical protein